MIREYVEKMLFYYGLEVRHRVLVLDLYADWGLVLGFRRYIRLGFLLYVLILIVVDVRFGIIYNRKGNILW